jgi:hypothetical protein
MINSLNINLDINPLREDLNINSYGTHNHIKISIDDINNDLILFLKTLNLTIGRVELFYNLPFRFSTIHLDDTGGDYIKLNYVFGGKNSLMYWWKQKPNISNSAELNALNSSYIDYKIDQVDLIDKQPVNFPSIVQVGIPHNIHNFEEPRYCLSLVLKKQDNTRLTMAESIEMFKQYL